MPRHWSPRAATHDKSTTETDPDLAKLKARYFAPTRAYDNCTQVDFYVDGEDYFTDLDLELSKVSDGDAVYILDWYHTPLWDILDRPPEHADYRPIGARLAALAQDKVDVRMILTGGRLEGLTNVPPFLNEYDAMRHLTTLTPPGAGFAPLAGRVLLDYSGPWFTGSHHEKCVVIRRQAQVIAYVSGFGLNDSGFDRAPHKSKCHQVGDATIVWGWHDAAVRLTGGAALAVYDAFAEAWEESSTLPPRNMYLRASPERLRPIRRVRFANVVSDSVPSAEPVASSDALPRTSVQILRSRYPTKTKSPFGRPSPWRTAGGAGLFEIYETLVKAIGTARRYIYIEDQFVADHPDWGSTWFQWLVRHVDNLVDRRMSQYSLLPALAAAAARGVKVIMVAPGGSDPRDGDQDGPGDPFQSGERNLRMNPELDQLTRPAPDAFAVWRILDVAVHAKVVIVDDEFAAVGSANIAARSMMGVDSELQVAVVSMGECVRDFRVQLWAEHAGIHYDRASAEVKMALHDEAEALGLWRRGWAGDHLWFTEQPDEPQGNEAEGFVASGLVRAYVGPGCRP